MVDNFKSEYALKIYINLDHSPSVEKAIIGIGAGFEFIHTDVNSSGRTVYGLLSELPTLVNSGIR